MVKCLKTSLLSVIALVCIAYSVNGQEPDIPKIHTGITYNEAGKMGVETENGEFWPLVEPKAQYTLSQMRDHIRGTQKGLSFNFQNPELKGTLYYGFIDPEKWQFPQPVFFKKTASIKNGMTSIPIKEQFKGKYDMVGWKEAGQATLGYRVTNKKGKLLYDGKVTFGYDSGKGFYRDTGIIEGPFLQNVASDGVTVMFESSFEANPKVMVNKKTFAGSGDTTYHEIRLKGLASDKTYDYTLQIGDVSRSYQFKTAPEKGAEKAFTFAYASDSRAGQGGGERNIKGANAYIMKKIGALANQEDARFMQFTGDLINGYSNHQGSINLEYANWKRAIGPFSHELPIFAGFGNHEAFLHRFDNGARYGVSVDKFPYNKHSAESVFSRNFANPENGPSSEDGAYYDPDGSKKNFPGYKETAFHYDYGNVAMIVLNSDYWYAPSLENSPLTGGGLHGYIMDQQLEWLKQTLHQYESDQAIDHIFVTLHTPFFPNGGHVDDDMWYSGQNKYRPIVDGEEVKKGIIERRDELLALLVNKYEKVRAILTGDEHNYNRLPIHESMDRYPENFKAHKVTLKDTLWQINNGAAGAPYYAQEPTPWGDKTLNFTTQNALVLFHVDGDSIEVEVINPDTLEVFDRFTLN